MQNDGIEKIFLPLLKKEIIGINKKFTLEGITGQAFEVFRKICPDLDYSKLNETETKKLFLNLLRQELFNTGDIPDEKKAPDYVQLEDPDINYLLDISDRKNVIETPLDIERSNIKCAFLLINDFFDLPIIEKEAYKLRVINQNLAYQKKQFEDKLLAVKKNKKLEKDGDVEKEEEIQEKIRNLEKKINLNSVSKLSLLFSNTGIFTLQRRASIRVKNQWFHLKKELNEEIQSDIQSIT